MKYMNIYCMLDENSSLEMQNQGIELASGMKEIDKFILPTYPDYNKNVWFNCAKIISERSDYELLPYVSKLLEWLQDLNWPGAFIIIERLKIFNGELLLNSYVEAIETALSKENEDREWANYLAVLIENPELAKNMPKEILLKVQALYNDFWKE